MKRSKYYKGIDIIRLFLCVAILFYHLNILKGGYLAVCAFFVLSAYLSTASLFKSKNISLKEYYLNRFKKIYLPLLIVVFITIALTAIIPNTTWLNLKPETTSVLFGYNNFWQLGANLDYFARHVSSPFMHFWYIAILIQFDIILPLIFRPLRRLGDKKQKYLPCIITSAVAVVFAIIFLICSRYNNIMFTYYHTITRIFSLLFGLSLGFIHHYYNKLITASVQKKPINIYVYWGYIFILLVSFIFVSADSSLFAISMVLVTLITCRLIDYSTRKAKIKLSNEALCIKSWANLTYLIYLVQYPLIFLFENSDLNKFLIILIIIILTILISYLINYAISDKGGKYHTLKKIFTIIIIAISLYGLGTYLFAKNHTKEMKLLEKQLAENAKLIEEKEKEYKENLEKEAEELNNALENITMKEEELKELVKKLPVVGLGDSILLGAVPNLYNEFKNGYFDGKVSRTAYSAGELLDDLNSKNMLKGPIIMNFGANGDCSEKCKIEIMEKCGENDVFWVTVTNDQKVHFNDKIKKFAEKYQKLHIIDWNELSSGHDEYFASDGIHLTVSGRKAYTKAIYDAIYKEYVKKYEAKKEELLKEHEEKKQEKISFVGNGLLLNAFDIIHNDFQDASFIIDKNYNYDTLKDDLKKKISEQTLNKRVVLAFDDTLILSDTKYLELIDMLKDYEVNILILKNISLDKLLEKENVKIINFYGELRDNPNYLMNDGIHFTEKGNIALNEALKKSLEK